MIILVKKNIMNRILITLNLFFLTVMTSFGQNGLENIIVEKYYVSDANDSIGTDAISANPGTLPVGSVTYRIYVDMLPGFNLQAIYGVPLGALSNEHEFRISTTTLFFNNEDRGATTPNAINNNFLDNNSVMLDSWLSIGAASSTQVGILKSKDNGVSTIVNADNMLQNNDTSAGIPLTVEDGIISGSPAQVATIGISTEIGVFDNQNDGTNGPVFSTINGSLYCFGGSTGPDSLENQVLVAQITTDGVLCFEFNIQLGTPSGGVQNYVASNPFDSSEIVLPFLTYCSNTVGVEEIKSTETSFSVFPNPATDNISIEIEAFDAKGQTSFKIIDLLGNILMQKDLGILTGKHMEDVDISSFSKGLYFVEINKGGITAAKKVIIN